METPKAAAAVADGATSTVPSLGTLAGAPPVDAIAKAKPRADQRIGKDKKPAKRKETRGAAPQTKPEKKKTATKGHRAKGAKSAASDDAVLDRAELEAAVAAEEMRLREMRLRKDERDALAAEVASARAALGGCAVSALDKAAADFDRMADEVLAGSGTVSPSRGGQRGPCAAPSVKEGIEAFQAQLVVAHLDKAGALASGSPAPRCGQGHGVGSPPTASDGVRHGRRHRHADPIASGEVSAEFAAPPAAHTEPTEPGQVDASPAWLDEDEAGPPMVPPVAPAAAAAPSADETLDLVSSVLALMQAHADAVASDLDDAAEESKQQSSNAAEDATGYSDEDFESDAEAVN
jgi:hypothetical protein